MIPSADAHSETTDFKPVLCGYIIDARSMIHPGRLPGQKVVHDVRVLMKKARAAIKLLRSNMDEDSFNREYGAFRETGRIMSKWRESAVHTKLLRDFRKRHPAIFARVKDENAIRQLLEKHDDPSSSVDKIREDLLNIMDILHRSSSRIRFLDMKVPDQGIVLDELGRSFTLVSGCYLNARHNPKDVNIHEFRKKTKDLLYQLFFFRYMNPKTVMNLEKKLDQLAQDLGKYNDYAVLLRTLDYKYETDSDNPALDDFAVIVRQEHDKYLMRIWPAAYRIFRPGKTLLV